MLHIPSAWVYRQLFLVECADILTLVPQVFPVWASLLHLHKYLQVEALYVLYVNAASVSGGACPSWGLSAFKAQFSIFIFSFFIKVCVVRAMSKDFYVVGQVCCSWAYFFKVSSLSFLSSLTWLGFSLQGLKTTMGAQNTWMTMPCVSQTSLPLIQMVFRGLPMGQIHIMERLPDTSTRSPVIYDAWSISLS